jgi:hypothetical protein
VVPALLGTLAYRRFVGVWWYADDYLYLFAAANGDTTHALLLAPPGHVVWTWNAVRWLVYEAAGPDPLPLAVLLIALHAMNSMLLGAFVSREVDTAAGLVAASVWAVAASGAGTLGWIAAGGHALTTTAILGLLLVLPRASIWSLTGLALLAGTSFGVGPPLVAMLAVTTRLLSPRASRHVPLLVGIALIVALALAALQGSPYSIVKPDVAAALEPTLEDAGTVLRLLAKLAATAVITLPAWPLVAVAVGVGCWTRPRVAGAMLLLAGTALATVAAGRASLVRAGFPIDAVAAFSRYAYAASAFVMIVAGCGLAALPARWRCILAVVTPLVLLGTFAAHPRVPPASEASQVHEALSAIAGRQGVVLNPPFPPIEADQLLFAPRRLFPGLAGAVVVFGDSKAPLRFRARSADEFEATARGGPIAEILLPPGQP